jgi:hypothetical protein
MTAGDRTGGRVTDIFSRVKRRLGGRTDADQLDRIISATLQELRLLNENMARAVPRRYDLNEFQVIYRRVLEASQSPDASPNRNHGETLERKQQI